MANATEQDLGRLARAIVDFQDRLTALESLQPRIFGTGVPQATQAKYAEVLQAARKTKARIEATENLWQRAKEFVGLGVVPLIPLAVVAALIAAIALSVRAINGFMDRQEIRALMAQNPGMSYDQAAGKVKPPGTTKRALNVVNLALWVGGGFLALRLLQEFRK